MISSKPLILNIENIALILILLARKVICKLFPEGVNSICFYPFMYLYRDLKG